MTAYRPGELERDVLRLWEREGTFATSLARREGAPPFSFFDGPPYATGSPHYGHVLQSTVKDVVGRYKTMRGFRVARRVGWDCHGLPVEHLVEKELGIRTKREIEERGIETFGAACRAAVLRYVDEWNSLLRRLGRWADYAHAYRTMDASFIESVWWVFQVVWEAGLIAEGTRSSPYCPRCETPLSNFETSLGYREVSDPALTVKVRLADEENVFLLVWTTTPWTLPGNAAVAVHPEARYVRVKVGDEHWILAKDRQAEVVREDAIGEDECAGSTLVGRTYEPLYTFLAPDRPAFRIVGATFVSTAEGTGLVHIAPAFGEEDFRLAEEEGLPLLETVDARGRFVPAVTPWAGLPVKEANAAILKDLEDRGLLLWQETIRHSYPHCWRCETPLLFRAQPSFFVRVTAVKDQLLRNAGEISWVPLHLKEGRFGQGLKEAPDWAISRNRYWGVPIPLWVCAGCGARKVIGSLRELAEAGGDLSLLRSPYDHTDLHRPYVDRVVLRCAACRGEARRVSEVLDVWFDSGSMPYGQWHYPFENREAVEKSFPADFVAEALEQTRGWFYTLHVLAGILTLEERGLGLRRPAFRNAVASGLILAEDGRKLSKRLGNYPDPAAVFENHGADTVRMYLLSATRFGEDLRFSERLLRDFSRRFTLLLWNVWQYYRTYAGGSDRGRESFLDRWIRIRTDELTATVQTGLDGYRLDEAARALIPFVEDLSTWYVRRSRGRKEALPVLREVLRRFSLVASPFIPFLTEHIHRELTGMSPHVADWEDGKGRRSEADRAVLSRMRLIRELASAGHRARAQAKIPLRQPLAEAVLRGRFPDLAAAGEEGLALLCEEISVKHFRLESPTTTSEAGEWAWVAVGEGKLRIRTTLTEELRGEGIVRTIIRAVQAARRKEKCAPADTIEVCVETSDPPVRRALESAATDIRRATRSRDLAFERRGEWTNTTELQMFGMRALVHIRK